MPHATTQIRHCYLVRHAIAEERGPAWPDDAVRPLTRDGQRRLQRVVRGLAALDVSFDAVMSSPLLRARQTAEPLAADLASGSDVIVLPELAPGGTPAQTMKAVARATDARSVALVGHEPDLGLLAAWLLGARQPLPFRKAGVCRVDLPRWTATSGSRLVWFATPKMLRQISRVRNAD